MKILTCFLSLVLFSLTAQETPNFGLEEKSMKHALGLHTGVQLVKDFHIVTSLINGVFKLQEFRFLMVIMDFIQARQSLYCIKLKSIKNWTYSLT